MHFYWASAWRHFPPDAEKVTHPLLPLHPQTKHKFSSSQANKLLPLPKPREKPPRKPLPPGRRQERHIRLRDDWHS